MYYCITLELDYKLLLDQPTADILTAHLLEITKPENVGMLMKFLRNLPASFKIPVSVNTIYTKWLGKLFFSVSLFHDYVDILLDSHSSFICRYKMAILAPIYVTWHVIWHDTCHSSLYFIGMYEAVPKEVKYQ